jgi:hypothetical protein
LPKLQKASKTALATSSSNGNTTILTFSILTGCQPLANMVEAPQERMGMTTLFTVGYEGSKPSDLIASPQNNGVTLLIDVRDVAISRKPGFSKALFRKV